MGCRGGVGQGRFPSADCREGLGKTVARRVVSHGRGLPGAVRKWV